MVAVVNRGCNKVNKSRNIQERDKGARLICHAKADLNAVMVIKGVMDIKGLHTALKSPGFSCFFFFF